MRKRSSLAMAALGVGVLAGCTGNVSAASDSADADSPSRVTALVSVDAVTGATGERKVSAVARFLRARDGLVDDDAQRMVHASLSLPDVGTCATPDNEPKVARSVSLSDLGSVVLESEGAQTSLVPRELPNVADLVDGVVYSSQASESDALPAHASYVLHAGGNENVPAFSAVATAPKDFSSLQLGAREMLDGRKDGGEAAVDARSPLDLRWDASTGEGDLVYVDVVPAGAETVALRCTFSDVGHGEVPQSAWSLLGAATSGQLLVHRVHREAIRAGGVDGGEVRFDFARQVVIRLR